jgi:methionyl-tRNA formyltransferase
VPLLIIGNLDDVAGKPLWHDSLSALCQRKALKIIKKTRVSSPAIIKKIKKIAPEIIFCIGSTQILPREILAIPQLGCLNIHPALLPQYRGRYSIPHAIFNGEKYTGVTLHWMDRGIDSGPIIMQERIKIGENDTAKTIYGRFNLAGERLFVKFLNLWLGGQNIPSFPQDENKASYQPKSLPNNGRIDWSWSGAKIRRFIRAMTFEPFPPLSFDMGKKKMVVIDKKYALANAAIMALKEK